MAFVKSYMIEDKEFFVECEEEMHQSFAKDQSLLMPLLCSDQGSNANEKNNTAVEILEVTENINTNKESSFTWDRNTTKLLIDSYATLKEKFRDPKAKKRDLWQKIVQKFYQKNYTVTADALDRKWRNMKKRYVTIRDSVRKTGRGRISWEYYPDLDDIYHEDRTINLPPTISSGSYVAPIDASLPGSSTAPPSQTHAMTALASVTTTGSVTTISKKHDKAVTMRGLHGLRKRLIDIEERRVEEIKKLRESIERSQAMQEKAQTIQIERNDILKQILHKLNSS